MSSIGKSKYNQEVADKARAREKLVRAKLYRLMALGCALAAIIISGYIFEIMGHSNSYHILRNPLIIAALLLPFVPAIFLAILSKRRRRQAKFLLKPYM